MFLEISQNLQENTCARVSFLIKFQTWGLQLYWKVSGTGVFLWILRNFQEHLSYSTPLDGCFWRKKKNRKTLYIDFLLLYWKISVYIRIFDLYDHVWYSVNSPSGCTGTFPTPASNQQCPHISRTKTRCSHAYTVELDLLFTQIIVKLKINSNLFYCFCWYCEHLFIYRKHSRHLPVQSQQRKHQNNVRNLFKFNNKDARATSVMSFWFFYRVFE